MIEIRCCHDLAEAAPLRARINALNLASASPDPFSTFEFYENHVRSAARSPESAGQRLWLLLAFRGSELVGYLALKRTALRVLGLRTAKLNLLTAHRADRPHLVVLPGEAAAVRAAIYAYLLQRRKEWSLLELDQQEADSLLLPVIPPLSPIAHRLRDWPNLANGTIALGWTSLAAYFAALSRKSRSNVGRQMRALLAAGKVEVLTSSDPRVLTQLFGLYCGAEAHSWKARTEAGFGGGHGWPEYYAGLMDPRHPMRIGLQVLLLDDVPVAGLMTGGFGDTLYALHIVHDERVARLAPGSAILLLGVRRAIEGGYRSFNLLNGFGYYKTRWLAQMRETRCIQVYRTGTPFYWRRALGDLWRRWRSAPGAAAAAVAQSNPARHEAVVADTPGPVAPEERAHWAALASKLRGNCEVLLSHELAAILPFATPAFRHERGASQDSGRTPALSGLGNQACAGARLGLK